MRIVIPGGSGQIGRCLRRYLEAGNHTVRVLSRDPKHETEVAWDGKNLGEWADTIDGADVIINLSGRNVNCRYTDKNLAAMMNSRVDSTRIVGQAIARSSNPPPVWLQMSTATIYAHRFDADNDEATGIIGGNEPDVPAYWKYSIDIAQAWEQEINKADTPLTRKVIMRAAMVMCPDRGGIFDTLLGLTRVGMGGSIAGGRQYVSWIHERDFVRAVELFIQRDGLHGVFNVAAPHPLPQRQFMAAMRKAWGIKVGLPATEFMSEFGAFFLRTDSELILKSRRVIPGRLSQLGFEFEYPRWPEAVQELVARWRATR